MLSNRGHIWTNEEESTLLNELNNNVDVELIAINHKRSSLSIKCKCEDIAYKLYIKNIPTEEIMKQTKLDKEQFIEVIKKRETKNNIRNITPSINNETKNNDLLILKNEISEIKNDIKEIKNKLNELFNLIK